MRKKNKKVSLAKKPFLVLSRRAIAGWVAVIFIVCGWMFGIGVLVGRGTAPIKFDITALQRKLEAAREALKKKEQGPALKEPESVKDKTDLDFFEVLKDNRDDAKIPEIAPPPITKKKVDPLPEDKPDKPKKESRKKKTFSLKKDKDKTESTNSEPIKPSEPPKIDSGSDTHPTGKPYAIQVAAFRAAGDADKLIAELMKKGFSAYRVIGKVPGQGIWYRVRIGDYDSRAEAGDTMSKLKKAGMEAMVVEK